MALLEIKFWELDDFNAGTKSAEGRCAWGGSSCTKKPEFTVTDRTGANIGACEVHTLTYIRDRLRNGA
ncbi:hypothetical protein GCM10023085_53390 [Actinomadura viridis]|uniref:Uncharacterized protein n=1 Tax=Actinomadura viridis TaxID=58110 RepID=A0A931DF47_9ACTN|nr:hypothetical protein [Actinomadura viridis]